MADETNKTEKQEPFVYTYSAQEQEEVQRIRQKYLPPEQSKLEQLRRLDASVTRPGTIMSILLGVAGTLVFGTGMCLVLVWEQFAAGIIVGVLGLAVLAAAYPVYERITARRRQQLAPQILKLTDELMK